jgi:hypothetical protein
VIYPHRTSPAHATLSMITLADGRVLYGAADFVRKAMPKPPAQQ